MVLREESPRRASLHGLCSIPFPSEVFACLLGSVRFLGRGLRGHRSPCPAPEGLERTHAPGLHLDEGELRLEAPEDRTPHLREARPHDGARVDVHTRPLSRDRLHRLLHKKLQEAEGVGVWHAGRGNHEGRELPALAGTPDPMLPHLLRVPCFIASGRGRGADPPGSTDADDTSDTSSTSPCFLTG